MMTNITTIAPAMVICGTPPPEQHADYALILAKVLSMIILGLGSLLLGVAPIELTKRWRAKSFSPSSTNHHGHHHQQGHGHSHAHPGDSATGSRIVSLLLCFGGGVLLCTTLLHLQPEVREGVEALQAEGRLPKNIEHLGDLLLCAGFFMVFIVDEIAHFILDRYFSLEPRPDGAGEDVLHRSLSLRRSLNVRRTLSTRRTLSMRRSLSMRQRTQKKTETNGDRDHEEVDVPKEEEQQQQSPTCDQQERYHQTEGTRDIEKQHQTSFETSGSEDHSLRGFFTVLALSLHEIFEGMAIGLEDHTDHVWFLFLAVATHKLVIAFCIGLELAWSGTRKSVLIIYVATFAMVTPIGIAIGMIIMNYDAGGSDNGTTGPVPVILQGLATGTLLYVVFFEVLGRHKKSGWSHLFAVAFGFLLLLMLQLSTPHHHHHHGHGHGHSHGSGDHTHDDHDHTHDDHDHTGHYHEHDHTEDNHGYDQGHVHSEHDGEHDHHEHHHEHNHDHGEHDHYNHDHEHQH